MTTYKTNKVTWGIRFGTFTAVVFDWEAVAAILESLPEAEYKSFTGKNQKANAEAWLAKLPRTVVA